MIIMPSSSISPRAGIGLSDAPASSSRCCSLSAEQADVVHAPVPLLLYGRSGTGKTMVLLERACSIPPGQNDACALFLTANSHLATATERRIQERNWCSPGSAPESDLEAVGSGGVGVNSEHGAINSGTGEEEDRPEEDRPREVRVLTVTNFLQLLDNLVLDDEERFFSDDSGQVFTGTTHGFRALIREIHAAALPEDRPGHHDPGLEVTFRRFHRHYWPRLLTQLPELRISATPAALFREIIVIKSGSLKAALSKTEDHIDGDINLDIDAGMRAWCLTREQYLQQGDDHHGVFAPRKTKAPLASQQQNVPAEVSTTQKSERPLYFAAFEAYQKLLKFRKHEWDAMDAVSNLYKSRGGNHVRVIREHISWRGRGRAQHPQTLVTFT